MKSPPQGMRPCRHPTKASVHLCVPTGSCSSPVFDESPHAAFYLCIFLTVVVSVACAQTRDAAATVKGMVRDSQGHPASQAAVHLQSESGSPVLTTVADSQGSYSFPSLSAGSYRLRAEVLGGEPVEFGPFPLASGELKTIDLTLVTAVSPLPGFYDEPQFTVAGVTQTGNAGGHGSDNVLRTSDALAKAAASLNKPSPGASPVSASAADLERARGEIRARLAAEGVTGKKQAELHHSLADLEERLDNPLAAVREYQRAAEIEPSESYLFDWGAELLSHRALEPAAEVFTKGHRLFPGSGRMLIALGVTLYARGSYDAAVQRLFEASDLNPSDPTAYLFLGKMLGVETHQSEHIVDKSRYTDREPEDIPDSRKVTDTVSQDFVGKFQRFTRLQPENALANYYYAVSLRKRSKTSEGPNNSKQVEALLEKAVRLDPGLSAGYLQLGILNSEEENFPRAIKEYQHAIESDPSSAEAHYRLSQAYRRTGEKEKAQRELQTYNELSKKNADQAERERREIQQFVITLRDGETAK
jgi:tetratricopeptide (TPR) repeat protein